MIGNPFSCDCAMEPFYSWLSEHESVLTRSRSDAGNKLLDGPSSSSPTSSSYPGAGYGSRDRRSSAGDRELPTCFSPPELKGVALTDPRIGDTCATPLITDLVVEGVEPSAILVSWDSPAFSAPESAVRQKKNLKP